MKNYFAFIDESGNLAQERFFGLGLLIIEDVGTLYDAIKPYYDKIRDIGKLKKNKTIDLFYETHKYEDLVKIAKSDRRFELKFKFVNFSNNKIYKKIIDTYFTFPNCRFSAVVIDREDPNFKPKEIFSTPWNMYMSYAAMLLAGNINNLDACKVCVLADDLSRPSNITKSFEDSLKEKISLKLKQDGIERNIFNVARLESHSSLMLQMVDILLGSVMYSFKKEAGLVSEKLGQRQDVVVEEMKLQLKRKVLNESFTVHKPSYFSVWKVNWQRSKK